MTTEQTSKVAVGFLIGVGVGAAVGLLFAPQSGKESQEWIAEKTKTGVDNLRTTGQRLKETAQNVTAQGRTQVVAAVEAGKGAYSQVVSHGKEAYRDAVSNG